MIDQEVISSAEYAVSVGQTLPQWIDELQYQTSLNPAFDKWEAAVNVVQDVIEEAGSWPDVLARLKAKAA